MTTPERTSYCVPCDRVVVWRTWRVWQKHLQSADHRECVLAPRPLPPDRIRAADLDDRNLGLTDGESVVLHWPDGPWIGLASLGGGRRSGSRDHSAASCSTGSRATSGPRPPPPSTSACAAG